MKTNLMKILLILAAMTFLGTATAMAKDRHGDRNQKRVYKNNVHHKIDRHHRYGQGNHYKKHALPRGHGRHYGPRYYGKHYGPKHYYKQHRRYHHHRPPVVHKHHHHYYQRSYGYPSYNSFSFGFSSYDPGVAFSFGVAGH